MSYKMPLEGGATFRNLQDVYGKQNYKVVDFGGNTLYILVSNIETQGANP